MNKIRDLPIFHEFEKFKKTWESSAHIILKSPTGSGKSTALPYLLVANGLSKGKILVVQPRRIAARMLAAQVSRIADWSLGKEVGYHVRFDKKYTTETKIIYVTDGIALSMLLKHEDLKDIEVLILDEFHERSAQIDVCLGLALKIWKSQKPEFRIIITSATVNSEALKMYLPDTQALELTGRTFPVQIEYRSFASEIATWKAVVELLPKTLSKFQGDILIFMDGAYEISKTVNAILSNSWSTGLEVFPLYGDLPPEKQDRALHRSSKRKIIVSTNVAETSLTIEGVRVVIDTGTAKKLRYDRNRGINSLLTEPISKSSAEQRSGRAGRTGPGYCFRLWSQNTHKGLPEFDPPEISRIDLSQIYLNLLRFDLFLEKIDLIEPVPKTSIAEVKGKLISLGAITHSGNLTIRGKMMAELPVHPTWAYALLEAQQIGYASTIALLLAMLDDRPPVQLDVLKEFCPLPILRSDPYCLLLAFEEASRSNFSVNNCRSMGIHAGRCKNAEKVARSLCALIQEDYNLQIPNCKNLSHILLRCFPNSLAFLLSSGRNIFQDILGRRLHLSKRSVLGVEEFVLPLQIVEKKIRGSITLEMEWVTGVDKNDIREFAADKIKIKKEIYLDLQTRKVLQKKTEEWGMLVLSNKETEVSDREKKAKAYAKALFHGDLKLKNWNSQVEQLLHRRSFLAIYFPDFEIKELDDEEKLLFLEQLCLSASSWKEIKNIEVFTELLNTLRADEKNLLNEAAPETIDLRNARRPYQLDYSKGEGEVILRAILQDLYLVEAHPKIVYGKHPLVIEILGPNRRPVQRTTDLPSFWHGTYPQIRKELAGRYPKHHWR